eukprot:2191321-Prymnesium_polylepis.1
MALTPPSLRKPLLLASSKLSSCSFLARRRCATFTSAQVSAWLLRKKSDVTTWPMAYDAPGGGV